MVYTIVWLWRQQTGQAFHAEVEVTKCRRSGTAEPWVTFKTCCKSANGTILVDGEAMARMSYASQTVRS